MKQHPLYVVHRFSELLYLLLICLMTLKWPSLYLLTTFGVNSNFLDIRIAAPACFLFVSSVCLEQVFLFFYPKVISNIDSEMCFLETGTQWILLTLPVYQCVSFLLRSIHSVKMATSPKSTYSFNQLPCKFPLHFSRSRKHISNIHLTAKNIPQA